MHTPSLPPPSRSLPLERAGVPGRSRIALRAAGSRSLARSLARTHARSHARTSPWLPVRSLAASALAPESASAETAELRRRDCGAAMAAAHAARAATDAGSAGAQVGRLMTAACFQTLAGAQPLPLLKEDERAREVRVRRAPCARASTRPRPQPSPGSLALPRSARAAGVRIRPVQDRPGVAWRALSKRQVGTHFGGWHSQWHSGTDSAQDRQPDCACRVPRRVRTGAGGVRAPQRARRGAARRARGGRARGGGWQHARSSPRARGAAAVATPVARPAAAARRGAGVGGWVGGHELRLIPKASLAATESPPRSQPAAALPLACAPVRPSAQAHPSPVCWSSSSGQTTAVEGRQHTELNLPGASLPRAVSKGSRWCSSSSACALARSRCT